jgi:hypothetical protein
MSGGKDIKCPQCFAKFRVTREHSLDRIRKDIQHHLYMHHSVEIIESHRLAREAIEKEEDARSA